MHADSSTHAAGPRPASSHWRCGAHVAGTFIIIIIIIIIIMLPIN
jgi:hypothetical protein